MPPLPPVTGKPLGAFGPSQTKDLHHAAGLDLAAIASWLDEWAIAPNGCRLDRVRLKRLWPGRRGRFKFELQLQLDTTDGALTTLLQGGTGGRPERYRPVKRARFEHHWARGLRAWNPDLGIWICTPDADPYLPAVGDCLKESRGSSGQDAASSAPGSSHEFFAPGDIEPIAYRTAKRCVLRVRARTPTSEDAYLKFFRRPIHPALVTMYGHISSTLPEVSGGSVRMPPLLELDEERRMIATKDVAQARPLGRSDDDLSDAAAAMSALHGIPSNMPLTHLSADELLTACRWVELIGRLDPMLSERFQRLIASLADESPPVQSADLKLIHRDLYGAQLLRDEQTTWLIDFDTMCRGHVELDLATFSAHLILDMFRDGSLSTPCMTGRVDRFTRAYQIHGGRIDLERLRFYLPCALARLGAIHAFRGLSHVAVAGMWGLAETYLTAPPAGSGDSGKHGR